MRIEIYTDTFLPMINGVVNSTMNLVEHLAQNNQITIHALCSASHMPKYKHSNVKIVVYKGHPLPRYPEFLAVLPPIQKVYRQMAINKPHLVLIITPASMGIAGMYSAKRLKIPTIGTSHTYLHKYLNYGYLPTNKITENILVKLLGIFYGNCTVMVAPTRVMSRSLRAWGVRCPIKVISNPIDFSKFKIGKSTRFKKKYKLGNKVVLHFGRIGFEKHIDVVVAAFERLTNRVAGAQLLIVGDGPALASLKKQTRALGISDKVIFTGYLTGRDLTDAICASTLFCTASDSESQGLVVLEAQACRKPIVAVNALGVGELVTARNGITVKPGDVDGLSTGMALILADRTRARKLGRVAYADSQKSSLPKIMEAWDKLITQTAKKEHP